MIDPESRVLIIVPKNIILESTWHKELYDAGISLRDIGVYYGPIKEYSKITITNMQNLNRIALKMFDMVVYDEIHNYGTDRLLPYVEKNFKYKLGLSATLDRGDNKHFDIMEIFDYNIFYYTPKEALSDGILNPFIFINIGVELDDQEREEYDKLTMEINAILQVGGGYGKIMRMSSGLKNKLLQKMNERKNLVNNYPIKFDVVKEICEERRNDKIIIFNEYNEQTNKSYWYMLDIGIKACIVHSGISKDKREEAMIGFKRDKYQVVLASKVLDEGYNLPKLDTAIIAAGNSTSRQTIQRMGRVLRRKPTQSYLYQVYCTNTVEQDYAEGRAKLFKDLCSNYEERYYNRKGARIKWAVG